MPRVALTPSQKRREWAARFAHAVDSHISKHDDGAPFRNYSEVADAVGISRPGLSQILNGKTMPTTESFARICTVCGIPDETVVTLIRQLGGIK